MTFWQLWRGQVRAVMRLELRRCFLSKRALWIYVLALLPIAVFAIMAMVRARLHMVSSIGTDTHIFANGFQVFFLRFLVFFGCAGVFLNLFHGDVLEKSLHFYFLAPIRREVLLAGKYLTGLTAASVIFCVSVALQFAALYGSYDSRAAGAFLLQGHGLAELLAYLGVTVLACAAYGSVFLFIGVWFRNALIPSIVVLVWEIVSGYLPPLLQKLSVIYYLKSLCPVEMSVMSLGGKNPLSLFTFNPEPALVPTAIAGVLVLTAALLTAASLRLRRMEIDYGVE